MMHANCVFFSRPMKRKSGTSAGIPRASGERGSPGAPARDKEVRKAPSPLPIATRRVLVPSRCGFSFFFLLCFFVVVSDQAPMIPSGPRVGERETRKCVCLPSGRTGVAGGLVGLGASARWALGWLGSCRGAHPCGSTAPAQHHHHVLLVKGVGAWHARALASGQRRDGPFPHFCRNMAHKTTSVSLIDAGTGS